MALSPTNNAALLQEVDEAVRKDRFESIWKNYGRWIIAAVIAALIAFGGWLVWNHIGEGQRGDQAEALVAALDKANTSQPKAATEALDKLIADGNDAYRAAALIQQANMKAQTGDTKAAAALMAKVAGDASIDQSLRDLALVRQTAFEFDTLKPDTVIARMKPLVDAKDPVSSWFPSAAELSAIAYYQLGKFDQAGALYGRIAKLPDVPKSLQSRSVQMAGMLGVDAVTDRAEESAEADRGAAPQSAAKDQKGAAASKAAAAKTSEEAE